MSELVKVGHSAMSASSGGSSIGWDPVQIPGVNEFARLSSVAQVMIRTRLPMALLASLEELESHAWLSSNLPGTDEHACGSARHPTGGLPHGWPRGSLHLCARLSARHPSGASGIRRG